MTWQKREPVQNLVVLGDDEGQVKKIGGLLAGMRQDQRYPSRHNYELVKQDGESVWLAGSASLSNQLFPGDVGKFVKCEFKGWGRSANGKFKDIEVLIYDGEPTADMKKWPRFAELSGKRTEQPPPPEPPEDEDPGGDDDLPF